MPRRELVYTSDLLNQLLGLADRVVILSATVNHQYGTINFIVNDPHAPPVPEGGVPPQEIVSGPMDGKSRCQSTS